MGQGGAAPDCCGNCDFLPSGGPVGAGAFGLWCGSWSTIGSLDPSSSGGTATFSPSTSACCFCVCPFPPPRKSNTEDSGSELTCYLYSQRGPVTRRFSPREFLASESILRHLSGGGGCGKCVWRLQPLLGLEAGRGEEP